MSGSSSRTLLQTYLAVLSIRCHTVSSYKQSWTYAIANFQVNHQIPHQQVPASMRQGFRRHGVHVTIKAFRSAMV